MEIKKTQRGFKFVEFIDRYGAQCSLQESSLADEAAIWFGPDDADPKRLVSGQGWQKVPFSDDTLFNTRMHLTQKQVKELLPYLRYFVKYGYLPEKTIRVRKKTNKKKINHHDWQAYGFDGTKCTNCGTQWSLEVRNKPCPWNVKVLKNWRPKPQ